MSERWLPIPEFEAQYEVSSLGRIRRIGKASVSGNGHGGGATIGRIKIPQLHKGGYFSVILWKGGRGKLGLVHVLVASAFIGRCPTGKEVNHKNGKKPDCRSSNLEYVTRAENLIHSYKTGLHPSGERHTWAVLTNAQVREIRKLNSAGKMGCRRLAKLFGVSKSCICHILRGLSWKHI